MNILKIQDGGWPPFLKIVLAISQQPIVIFQWNFAWGSSFSENFRNGTYTRVPQNMFFCFPAVWVSASGGFRIVSDTLVAKGLFTPTLRCATVTIADDSIYSAA